MKNEKKLSRYLHKWVKLFQIDDVALAIGHGSVKDHPDLKEAVAFTMYGSNPDNIANIIVKDTHLKSPQLESTVVHELIHVLTGPMRDLVYKHVKQCKHQNLYDDLEETLVFQLEAAFASLIKKRQK